MPEYKEKRYPSFIEENKLLNLIFQHQRLAQTDRYC